MVVDRHITFESCAGTLERAAKVGSAAGSTVVHQELEHTRLCAWQCTCQSRLASTQDVYLMLRNTAPIEQVLWDRGTGCDVILR